MRKRDVFLDSGIFIALLNRRDRFHSQAQALFSGKRVRWCTSALVRSEAYSWFLHKFGEESARQFRLFLNSLPDLVVIPADENHHGQVGAVLDRLRGSKLTYVDASAIAIMEKGNIKRAWATDHHLGITGIEILPRI